MVNTGVTRTCVWVAFHQHVLSKMTKYRQGSPDSLNMWVLKVQSLKSLNPHSADHDLPWYRNTQSHLQGRIQRTHDTSMQTERVTRMLSFIPPRTHHYWVGRGRMEWEVCLTLLHVTSGGNWTPDLLILSPTPCLLDHIHVFWGMNFNVSICGN